MQPGLRDGLAVLITELEAAGPAGLGDRRTAFRQQGQIANPGALSPLRRQELGMDQLLEQRAELLVGVKLLRAGVLERMGTGTPDFECRWQHTEFGVEVTTRARPEAAWAMEELLETGLQDGPDVGLTLMRTEVKLFSESPGKTAGIADQVSPASRNSWPLRRADLCPVASRFRSWVSPLWCMEAALVPACA
jgi:hypothetical protein